MGRQIGFGPSEELGPGASIFLLIGCLVIVSCLFDRGTLAPFGIAHARGTLGAYAANWGSISRRRSSTA